MAIIDVHHHWINEADYLDHLLREMDRLGVERAGLMALGAPFQRLFLTVPEPVGCCDNKALAAAVKQHPDRFYGYGFFHLGVDEPQLVDWFAEQGFPAVKFHIPKWDYDDERAFAVYERAQANNMFCIFHTGVSTLPEPMPELRASSARCRPIMLDAISNVFPDLTLIIAHLGVCWGEEAATLCRILPNVYADLSGNLHGWRASKSTAWWKEMLYWPDAHRKILFGSDVHYNGLADAVTDQTRIMREMGWNQEQINCVLYDNAANLLAGARS